MIHQAAEAAALYDDCKLTDDGSEYDMYYPRPEVRELNPRPTKSTCSFRRGLESTGEPFRTGSRARDELLAYQPKIASGPP